MGEQRLRDRGVVRGLLSALQNAAIRPGAEVVVHQVDVGPGGQPDLVPPHPERGHLGGTAEHVQPVALGGAGPGAGVGDVRRQCRVQRLRVLHVGVERQRLAVVLDERVGAEHGVALVRLEQLHPVGAVQVRGGDAAQVTGVDVERGLVGRAALLGDH